MRQPSLDVPALPPPVSRRQVLTCVALAVVLGLAVTSGGIAPGAPEPDARPPAGAAGR